MCWLYHIYIIDFSCQGIKFFILLLIFIHCLYSRNKTHCLIVFCSYFLCLYFLACFNHLHLPTYLVNNLPHSWSHLMIKYFIFTAHWNVNHYHLPTASKHEPVQCIYWAGKTVSSHGQWPVARWAPFKGGQDGWTPG